MYVSLLVRLWVEMATPLLSRKTSISSASLWGCELKYQMSGSGSNFNRQPPCEAVSWNFNPPVHSIRHQVSLLVRLWVEMLSGIARYRLGLSASLWGCELKFDCLFAELPLISQPPCEAVSWNMANVTTYTTRAKSASLWGCELKYKDWGGKMMSHIVSLLVRLWVEMPYSVRMLS